MKWSPISGATGYGLYIKDIATDTLVYDNDYLLPQWTEVQIHAGVLQPGRAYRWNTRAKNAQGWSDFSQRFYFTTASSTFSAPGPLEVQYFPDHTEMGWTDNTTDEDGFKIERSTNGTSWSQVKVVASSASQGQGVFWQDDNVNQRTTYYYRVRAYNRSTHSDYSNVVYATTPSGPPGPFTLANNTPIWDSSIPGAKVTLSWTASQDVGGYSIYRDGAILPGGGGVTSPFTDSTGLAAGSTHTYFVRASNADGTRDSNTVTITMPSVPSPNLAISNAWALQRSGSKQVDIYYTLTGASGPVTVGIEGSSNGGSSFALPMTSVSGHVGSGVTAGSNRQIVWNAGVDWNNQTSSTVKFRISAADKSTTCPNITVDTRDLVIGDLTIEGPDSIAPFQKTPYIAKLDGVNVTSLCTWPLPKTTRTFADWSAYPSISGLGMLDPNSAQPGDVITLTARYAEPGGDTRQAVKKITVSNDDGLYFGIQQDIDYLGPAGIQQFDWQLTASVSGLAASQSGITYSWYLNGFLKESGPAKTYILQRRGLPTVMGLRLVADDGQGHTGEQSVKLDFRALAPGEPGQRYDAWRKAGVSFTNELGVPVVPDPARKTKGLIVLTHGLNGSPYDGWIKSLAAEIESKLAGPDLPNIVIFGWNQYATPNLRYDTSPQDIENLVVPYLQVKGGALAGILKADKSYLDDFFDFSVIRPVAENVGRSKLAEWFVDEELLGNISKTARIHLIGHSAGGFVMGECYKELRNKGFNIQRVTMLDTPFVNKLHVDAGNPAVIERYVSSLFGKLCPEIDPIRYGPVGPPYIDEKPESAYYHRLDVGNGDNLNPKEAHGYSHDWYQGTVPSNPNQEGFQLSPFITGALIPAPTSDGPQKSPIPMDGPVKAPLPPSSLSGFTTFGSVSGSGSPYVLTESGNSGIVKSMTLPADAAGLTFQYQFTSPGDGDFLEVFFGDNPPLYIASPTTSNTQGAATAEISLAPFAGQTGNLVIKLVAQEAANAVVTVENILLTLNDDIDGDGLLAAAEVTAGTDPRFADSDGDGISDPSELNTTLTNPVRADSDGDGTDDGSELAAGTNPLDGSSRFTVKSSLKQGDNFSISWSSVAGKTYRVLRSPTPDFATYDVVGSGITATPPEQWFVDGDATTDRAFYRVELEP